MLSHVETDEGREKFPKNKYFFAGIKVDERRSYKKAGCEGEVLLRDENLSVNFEDTFLPHLDAAYNLARWLTRDPTDADDVVQEAYMRAFRFFDSYRGGDSRAWVMKIVRNTCYSWLEKNRSHENLSELDDGLHPHDPSDPEKILIENIDNQKLMTLIEELPAEFREVVVLRDVEGMSYKDIAAIADLPLGTVMSRLARARRKLQAGLTAFDEGGVQ